MAQPGFDPRRLSAGSRGLLAAGVVLLVDLFLSWESVGGGQVAGVELPSITIKGYSGMGWLALLLVLGLLVWEGVLAAGVKVDTAGVPPHLISVGIAGAVVLVGVIRFLVALTRDVFSPAFGAWLGLIALAAMAYAAWIRFNERSGDSPPRPS